MGALSWGGQVARVNVVRALEAGGAEMLSQLLLIKPDGTCYELPNDFWDLGKSSWPKVITQ